MSKCPKVQNESSNSTLTLNESITPNECPVKVGDRFLYIGGDRLNNDYVWNKIITVTEIIPNSKYLGGFACQFKELIPGTMISIGKLQSKDFMHIDVSDDYIKVYKILRDWE